MINLALGIVMGALVLCILSAGFILALTATGSIIAALTVPVGGATLVALSIEGAEYDS